MSASVSQEKLWKSLLDDWVFDNVPAEFLEKIKPFFIAMPEVLKDYLNEPLTIGSFLACKMLFLQYLVNNDFEQVCINALPAGYHFKNFDKVHDALIVSTSEPMKYAVAHLSKHLENASISEDKLMLGLKLKPEVAGRYQRRSITIAEFLELQPALMLMARG